MEDGRWKMGDGRWEMEDGRWKMEDGRWKRREYYLPSMEKILFFLSEYLSLLLLIFWEALSGNALLQVFI